MVKGSKVYKIKSKRHGITCYIANKHTERYELTWYDEEKGESRALRYATNHKSIFEDEQTSGIIKTAEIVAIEGILRVDLKKPQLIKFLEHHPDNVANGGSIFEEVDHAAENKAKAAAEERRYEAMTLARELEPSEQKAIARAEIPTRVDKMSEEAITDWIKPWAENNPDSFLEMAEKFTELSREDVIKTAVFEGVITFKRERTEVAWSHGARNAMICRIPTGEDPDEFLERFLMSKEGIPTMKDLEEMVKK